MSSHAALTSTLAESTGLDLAGLVRDDEPTPAVIDPLPELVPSDGRVVHSIRDVLAAWKGAESGRVDVSGLRGSASAALAAEIVWSLGARVVFVAKDADSARKRAGDLAFFLGGASADEAEDTGEGEVLVLIAQDTSPYAEVNPDRRSAMARMATLSHLAEGRPYSCLVIDASSLARKVVPKRVVEQKGARVSVGERVDRTAYLRNLAEIGYLAVPVVEDPGSYAIRGGLIDLWPPNRATPVRLEFVGDELVSIRPFDPLDQRTAKDSALATLPVAPVREAILDGTTTQRARRELLELCDAIDYPTTKARPLIDDVAHGRSFFGADGYLPAYYERLDSVFQYVGKDAVFVLEDPDRVLAAARELFEHAERDESTQDGRPHFPKGAFVLDPSEVDEALSAARKVMLWSSAIEGGGDDVALFRPRRPMDVFASAHEDLTHAVRRARSKLGRDSAMGPLVRRIAHWQAHGLSIWLTARTHTQAERLASLLKHSGVSCHTGLGAFDPTSRLGPGETPRVNIVVGTLSEGHVLPADARVFVTEEEIFGARTHKSKPRKQSQTDAARPFLEDLRALVVGDFVVHTDHGVGRYLGLEHRAVGDRIVDLLCVEYAGGDKLFLPIYRLNQIQKYAGGEHAQPKLDRLGGSTFAKTKAKVAREVRQMADELLRLYAERKAAEGQSLPPIDDDYRAFEATFPYDETADQAQAIEAVLRDLEAPRPMDRLVCGDVGFGKTEVAIRAAFRCALSGRQVAVLCPTTVLAQQHLRTFETRMQNYPITIRGLSRFVSKKHAEETMRGVKEGGIDIVVATHRLLSKDIHFKRLGLLIVDEEQRFGVTHKERIKQLRANVDVLTLSATPIPRTLHMAIGGLRDLSLITTPPVDRRAVRTIVTRYDKKVLHDAIDRELSRGGQIFYVYNRIEGLYERAQRIAELVPQARIAVAHGQMTKGAKEGDTGVLEETMLDFVEGRYDILVSTAIVESGLDIPRANTIIIDRADRFGLAQLYQLRGRVGRSRERGYCYLVVPEPDQITDEARSRIEAIERHTELGSGFRIASLDMELRGAGDLLGAEQSGSVSSVGLDLFCHMLEDAVAELRGEEVVPDVDTELSFDVTALLPEEYVEDVGLRLSFYKRLSSALDEAEVDGLAAELENRFGPPPEEVMRLFALMRLKTELRRLRVSGCEASASQVTLHLCDDTPLDPRRITELVRRGAGEYRLTPDMKLVRRARFGDGLEACEAMLRELGRCLKA